MKGGYSVYKHTCNANGKVYIGLTVQVPERRWSGGKAYRWNKDFNADIMYYGWENFSHEVLLKGLTEEQAKQTEIELIRELKSEDPKLGYNRTKGGETTKLRENILVPQRRIIIPLLTLSEVSKFLKVSDWTVRNAVSEGALKALKVGCSLRFEKETVIEFGQKKQPVNPRKRVTDCPLGNNPQGVSM